jgi:hypothetical protein
MGRFKEVTSANSGTIVGTRSGTSEKKAKNESSMYIQKLEADKIVLESKIDDLSDFGPDESTSLRPVDKGFNFTKWVVELNETTLALELQEIKLKSANKVHNEWFGDDKK